MTIDEQLNDHKRHLVSEYAADEVPLRPDSNHDHSGISVYVPVAVNGRKPLMLRVDTGITGVLLNKKKAERVGVKKIAQTILRGLGDEGDREAYEAVADRVQIGNVVFADCTISVSNKKALLDEDGIIGPAVFSEFLVTLDFRNQKLRLDQLPGGRPDPEQSYDRIVSPEVGSFIPVYRRGDGLLIPARINDTGPLLFVLDTGAAGLGLLSRRAT